MRRRFLPLLVALVAGSAAAQQERGPATIDAEHIEGVADLEVTARGKVEFQRDDITVFSEYLKFNQELGRVEADGGVRLERGVDRFFGPRLRYDTTNDTGVFDEPNFLLRGEQDARGSARRMDFLGRGRYRILDGTFTTCAPGREDWRVEARELELDYDASEGRIRQGRIKMFDTTVLAVPYGWFPLESQRKSGFLRPYYTQSTRRGLELGLPYYWNIAPEKDLTVTEAFMTKRGSQTKADYRYIDPSYYGNLHMEYVPHDRELNTSRSGFSFQHSQQFSPGLLGRVDLNRVSDDQYFVDFASQVRTVSIGNLPRDAYLQYSGAALGQGYGLQVRAQSFQTLQDPTAPVVSPYHRLPQVNFSTARNNIGGFADLSLPAEYVHFTHPTLVEGSRFALNPTLQVPFLAPGYFLTPKFGWHYVSYVLNNNLSPGQGTTPTVSVPWFSLDGGLVFDRNANWFGQALTQTLEPRLYYLYAPNRQQSGNPLFDTGLADFNYAQIFSENRFAGNDRFGDANQLTLAATSRLLGPSGQELLRGTLAQRYYFKNEEVGLTPDAALRSFHSSDVLASIGGRFAQGWTFDTSIQQNNRDNRTERFTASLRYSPEIAKVLSASYRFNRDILRQLDLSGQWPVQTGWYAIGRFNYSLFDKRLLEGLAGLEYNGGCWVFRAVFDRIQATTGIVSTAMFFQIEFNGFGGLGSDDTVNFLKRSVPGYSVTNPSDRQLMPPSARARLPFEQVF